ncbi:MAG: 5'-nucleotidase, lipoprotein e(P4) family [Bacteroidales bacterium]|nr:5'-nucleotidase, lipoprotein e(P4) family [Bacteroidales bacterium]
MDRIRAFFFIRLSLLPVVGIILLFAGCCRSNAGGEGEEETVVTPNEYKTMAVLYQQRAAECRALQHQAFHVARQVLDSRLRRMGLTRQQAVITDIDETVLDNSPYEAKCILDGLSYPEQWKEWLELAAARPIPGALEFLKYAESKRVEVFYVTNRKEEFREATLRNLQAAGFPFADNNHLLMRTTTSSKEERRREIMERYEVLMLLGDNLNDFSELFYKQDMNRRAFVTDSLRDAFGDRFIVLPNPIYGDWEDALYGHTRDLTQEEKQEMRRGLLEKF